jgi:hypothetical protein
MRKGNGGPDMFERCLFHGVAAIHYNPVESVNLNQFSEADPPPEWGELESSQSGSLRKFAWRVRGGDTIYVAESYPSRLVGLGRVRGSESLPAYQYREKTPIMDDEGHPWRHILDVEWEQDFDPVAYPEPWAAQTTVLDLEPSELTRIQKLLRRNRLPNNSRATASHGQREESPEDLIQQRQLEDWAYTRYTTGAIKTIQRRHVALCNRFTGWLTATLKTLYRVERRNIDLTFRHGGVKYLVEFKIVYSGDPKPAIREALGQILEYNYYPGRYAHDKWVLVLDCKPNSADLAFLERLRQLSLPISLGWPSATGFEFSDGCSLCQWQ